MARKIKYNKAYHDREVFKLAYVKKSDSEIATIFNINRNTFYNWLKKYPTFKKAYDDGKLGTSKAVESLEKLTQQQTYKEIKEVHQINELGELEVIGRTETQKETSPNFNAIKYVLDNLEGEYFGRDKASRGQAKEGKIFAWLKVLDATLNEGINPYLDNAYKNYVSLYESLVNGDITIEDLKKQKIKSRKEFFTLENQLDYKKDEAQNYINEDYIKGIALGEDFSNLK